MPFNLQAFRGHHIAKITPFAADGTLDNHGDHSSQARLIQHILAQKPAGIVVSGGTAEFPHTDMPTRMADLESVLGLVGGRVPVTVNITESMGETDELSSRRLAFQYIKAVAARRANAVMYAPFYGGGITENNIVDAISPIADLAHKRELLFFLYLNPAHNHPTVMGVPSVESIEILRNRKHLDGVKVSHNDIAYLNHLAVMQDDHFLVFQGSLGNVYEGRRMGIPPAGYMMSIGNLSLALVGDLVSQPTPEKQQQLDELALGIMGPEYRHEIRGIKVALHAHEIISSDRVALRQSGLLDNPAIIRSARKLMQYTPS